MIIQQIHNQLSGKDIYYKNKYYTWQSCKSSLLLTVTLSIDQSNKVVNVLNQMKRQIMKQQNKTYYNKQKHFFHTDTYPVFWPVTLGTCTLWVWGPGLGTVRTKIQVLGQVGKLHCYGKHFWILVNASWFSQIVGI